MSAAPAPDAAAPAPAIDIRDHVGLVHMTIRQHGLARYTFSGAIDSDDLLQAGLLGLHRASQTWDPALGAWSTYASYWARQSVFREIQNRACTVRVPVHAIERRRKAGERKWPVVRSLAAPIRGHQQDGGVSATLEDLLPSEAPAPDAGLEAADTKRLVDRLLETAGLTGKELTVVRMRAYRSMTLVAIGDALDLTRERVRQIESAALRKLQRAAGVAERGGSLAEAAST